MNHLPWIHAVDYLLKPISFERLLDAVNNFKEVHVSNKVSEVQNEDKSDFIFLKIDRKMHKIDFPKILWIESLSDYLKIETSDGTKVTRETISSIEMKLPKSRFLRIHRSFIIAIDKIQSYSNEDVIIQNKSIPISRTYKDQVLQVFEKFK